MTIIRKMFMCNVLYYNSKWKYHITIEGTNKPLHILNILNYHCCIQFIFRKARKNIKKSSSCFMMLLKFSSTYKKSKHEKVEWGRGSVGNLFYFCCDNEEIKKGLNIETKLHPTYLSLEAVVSQSVIHSFVLIHSVIIICRARVYLIIMT